VSSPQLRLDAARAKRIVVKIGSGTLTEAGRVRTRVVGDLARQVATLFDSGKEVVVVSSGAIAIGARSGSRISGARHSASEGARPHRSSSRARVSRTARASSTPGTLWGSCSSWASCPS